MKQQRDALIVKYSNHATHPVSGENKIFQTPIDAGIFGTDSIFPPFNRSRQ
jgi:hypothetical protein